LVVDSPLENEGWGWAGSGANPWHLDRDTESFLFLTDMGSKPTRIGFAVTASGVHYYLTNVKLQQVARTATAAVRATYLPSNTPVFLDNGPPCYIMS